MSQAQKEYSRDESVLILMSIPDILKSSELVSALEEDFQFAGNKKPSITLLYWQTANSVQKFQLLGWIKGGLARLKFRAIQYIDLFSKLNFEYAIIAVLQNATEEERKAYEEEFNRVMMQKK